MNTSALETTPRVREAAVIGDELIVRLKDGRTFSAPLSEFPRLLNATPAQRRNLEVLGDGEGIHWPDVDEDLSVRGLLSASKLVARDLRISMSLPATVVLALGLAVLSCLTIPLKLGASPVLAAGWVVVSAYAFVKYRWRAWAVLLGAPPCGFIFWVSWVFATCASHGGCP